MSIEVKDAEDMTEEALENEFSESAPEVTEESEESIETETETSAEEAIETETETSEDSTEEKVDPSKSAFEKSVLSKTYANEEAVFAAHEAAQSRVGQLERELSEVRGQKPTPAPAPQKEPEYDPNVWAEKYQTDPVAANREYNRLYPSQEVQELRSEVQSLSLNSQLSQAAVEFPDIVEKQSELLAEIESDSMLKQLYNVAPGWTIKQARIRLREKSPPKAVEKKIETSPVSEEEKESATTVTSGQAGKRTTTKQAPSWDDMNEDAMEKELGFGEE